MVKKDEIIVDKSDPYVCAFLFIIGMLVLLFLPFFATGGQSKKSANYIELTDPAQIRRMEAFIDKLDKIVDKYGNGAHINIDSNKELLSESRPSK